MRIGLLVNDLLRSGGTQRTVFELEQCWRRQGHEVQVYALHHDPATCFPGRFLSRRVSVLQAKWKEQVDPYQEKGRLGSLLYRFFRPLVSRVLAKSACRFLPEGLDVLYGVDQEAQWIIHAYKKRNPGTATYWACLDLPYCFDVGTNIASSRNGGSMARRFRNAYCRPLERAVLSGVDTVIVHSRRNARYVEECYGRKALVVFPGGVEDDRMSAREPRMPVAGEVVIGTLAGLQRYRRHEDLILAASQLHKHGLLKRCCIAGFFDKHNDYYKELDELICREGLKELVVWLGPLDEAALPDYFRSLDFFIWPNHMQSWGCAVFEAMAQSVPAVVSRSAGASEVLKNGESAMLVEPLSPELIAEAVEYLLKDPDRYRKIALGGSMVARSLTWQEHAMRNLEIVEGKSAGSTER